MVIEASNLIYISNFNIIGGLETFIYELAKKYHKYDIAVVYNTGYENQIKRLKKYVRVIKNEPGNKYKAKKCFINYDTNILNQVEADEIIMIIHAMYKTQNINPCLDKRITGYYAVSEAAKKEFEQISGRKVKVARNPLSVEPEEPAITLISATRLTKEKGKDRIIKLAEEMEKAGIKYTWLIFTNDTMPIKNPNIVYMKPRLDVRPFIAGIKGHGYGVQLSDCEGDCYFTRECEALGVPLIVTPIPSFIEQGLKEGINCYFMPFNMKDININRIRQIPQYQGYLNDDNWEKYLVKKKSKYQEGKMKKFRVEATDKYEKDSISDSELNTYPKEGFKWIVSEERKDLLEKNGFVKVIEEIKDEPKKEQVVEVAVEKPKKETTARKTRKKTK